MSNSMQSSLKIIVITIPIHQANLVLRQLGQLQDIVGHPPLDSSNLANTVVVGASSQVIKNVGHGACSSTTEVISGKYKVVPLTLR